MYLRALQDITNSTEATINPLADEEDSADHAFEFSFVSTIVAAIILLMCLREFYVRRYGVDFCPAFQMFHFTGSNHRPGQSQVDRDRAYAQEVQRQLDLENHEAELEAKRKDRKEWYEAYVVPFTMTVEESDFFYAKETDENGNTILADKLTPTTRKYSSSDREEVAENSSNELDQEPGMVDEELDDSRLCLMLPTKDGDGHCRSVEATCTICFSEYEQGDRVVWSDLRCKHAFHYDCILPWLVKGKKRCPICRDWFVPGARIEDQKKALAERLARENTTSTTSERSDDTDGPDCHHESRQGVQRSSDSEAASSDDDCGCGADDDSRCRENSERRKNGTRCADLENQYSYAKQLSSSEADDEATSSSSNENQANGSSEFIVPIALEVVPTNLEYPATTSDAANSLTILDGDNQQAHHENSEERTPPTFLDNVEESPPVSHHQMDFIPDDLSISQISETREMSA